MSEEEHVYALAGPDLTLTPQVRQVGGGQREVEMEERGEDEDRGEREERMVDIYVTADDLRPARTQNTAAPQQHGGSHQPKNNRSKAAAGCLGTLCLLLLAVIIGLVMHNNNLVKHLEQLELHTRQNLNKLNVTFQTRLDELQTIKINLTKERDDLKTLCELAGWQKFGSIYYYISTENKSWEESRQYCQERQSDLLVIKSKEKQDFVDRLGQRVWLGLTDREIEGHFKWVDGTALTTSTFWNPKEPNGNDNTDEDCVEFRIWPNHRGWNDLLCTERIQWICERVIN